MTFLCYSVITASHNQIEKTFDIVSDPLDFDNKRVHLQRLILGFLNKYKSQKFSLFPHALDRRNNSKNKDEWAKELDDLFFLRMNKIINEIEHAWWATTIEEIVKAQLFFDSLKKEFVDIDSKVEFFIKRKQDILHFDQPDDVLFDKWMAEIAPGEHFEEDETDSDEVQGDEIQIIDIVTTQGQEEEEEEDKNDQSLSVVGLGPQDTDTTKEEGKVEVTPTIQDKDGENPQVEINLQSSEQTSSLASLVVAYTEDSEQQPNQQSQRM